MRECHIFKLPATALGRLFLRRALKARFSLAEYGPDYDWDSEAKSIRAAIRWCERQERSRGREATN